MSMDFEITHDSLDALLQDAGVLVGASESQGLIAGFIIGGGALEDTRWLSSVLPPDLGEPSPENPIYQALATLYARTEAALHDENLEFALLLPDDEAPLKARIHGLSTWCHGFITGVGFFRDELKFEEAEDIFEAFRDVEEIAKISTDVDEEDDESEAAYMQIVEHLKVIVLLMFSHSFLDNLEAAVESTPATETVH